MADIANIGFSADTSALKDAKASLDALVPAAVKADSSSAKLAATAGKVDAAMRGASNASEQAASGIRDVGAATSAASGQMNQANAHVLAYQGHLRQIKIDAMAAGKAIKFTAQDSLNATRQLADIGVTAAMGISPFMIAIQQGPQLLDILQNKAATTGQSLGAVFRAAGAAVLAALAPLLPFIVGIGLAVGTVAAAFGLATREINKGVGYVASGLDLTEKQLKRLKKAGVDTSVTMGDTFKAFFQIIGERIAWLLGGPVKAFSDAWAKTMDAIVKYGTIAIKGIIGGFVGAFYAIKAAWSLLPAAIGDLTFQAANATVTAVEYMVNKAIGGLNKLIGFANVAAAKVGLPGLSTIGEVSFTKGANPFAGAAANAGSAIAEGFAKGKKASDGAVDRFFSDVAKRARANRKKLILDAAGDAEKGPKDPKGPKSDAAKFADIVTGAEADIATQKARGEATKLSAEAAATLEQKTKLLNEAQSKGITLTAAMRTKIDELAAAYGAAKIAADNAIALRDILKAADGDIAALKSQAELIGLTGRQLAYQTEMQKLLNEAKAKGLAIDAATRAQFEAKANQFADQSQANARDAFMAENAKNAQERMTRLKEELSYIGLSADQVARLRAENEALAQARQRNIDLTPADIESIKATADAQADLETKLRKAQERMQFVRDTAKGFFKDFTDGLRNGKSLWDSFADAAQNALNRILDRLLDKAFDAALDAIISVIGKVAGGGFAKGGAFNKSGVTGFANGGAFTNSVVNTPTLFAFARGGALGVMGEAGPEAIMPLQRGSDGSLGVQMYGGGGGRQSSPPNVSIEVKNTYTLSGAISSQDVVNLTKESAKKTEDSVKRNLASWMDQYQRDGAFAS